MIDQSDADSVFNAAWCQPVILGDHEGTRRRQVAAAIRAAAAHCPADAPALAAMADLIDHIPET